MHITPSDRQLASVAFTRLERTLTVAGFVGYDPYDGLKSPLLRPVAVRSRRAGQVLIALNRLSPLNVRPLLGVRPSRNAKASALLCLAFLSRLRATGDQQYARLARRFTTDLQRMAIPSAHGAGWGYDFVWANRSFLAPAGTPNAVVTAFAIEALSEAQNGLGVAFAGELEGGLQFLLRDLHWLRDEGGWWVSYTPVDTRVVYNACALVARSLVCSRQPDLVARGMDLALHVAAAQGPAGEWRYGSAASDGFIDGFHTGFVLRSLADIHAVSGDERLAAAVERGLHFYTTRLIDADGAARAAPEKRYPIDIHAWAEALLVAARFDLPYAGATLRWGLTHLQRPDGHFAYQRYRWVTLGIPYLRWADSWSLLALARGLEEPVGA